MTDLDTTEPTYADLTDEEKSANLRAIMRERLEVEGIIPKRTRGPDDLLPLDHYHDPADCLPTRYGPEDLKEQLR